MRLPAKIITLLLPLLAFPLGLAAKRGNRTPGLIIAGVLLLAFQHSLQLGQSMAEAGRAMPLVAIGVPFLLFTGFSVWMFVGSRKRPGQTPVTELIRRMGVGLVRFRRMFRSKFERANA